MRCSGAVLADADLAHQAIGLAPHEVDAEQPIAEIGGLDLDAVGQHERAAELPGGDAAMNEVARLVVLLPAADGELVVLQRDVQLIALEARYRQNDAQAF